MWADLYPKTYTTWRGASFSETRKIFSCVWRISLNSWTENGHRCYAGIRLSTKQAYDIEMLEILHLAEYFRKNNSIHRKIVELKITKTLIRIIFQPAFQVSLRRSPAEVIEDLILCGVTKI